METQFSDLTDYQVIIKVATTIELMEVYDKAIVRTKDTDLSTANLAEKLRTETDTLDLLIREICSRMKERRLEDEPDDAEQATEDARVKAHRARCALERFVPRTTSSLGSSIDEYFPAKHFCQETLDDWIE